MTSPAIAKVLNQHWQGPTDGFLAFSAVGRRPLLGNKWIWQVIANNAVLISSHDTQQEASLNAARLNYERRDYPFPRQIGLDGVA